MYKELQDLIRQITNDSGLTGEAGELLLKELESHMYEQIHDLELKGWSKPKILDYIAQKFGSSEQLGRELALAHKNTLLYTLSHFLFSILSLMSKHTKKILSFLLLLVALGLNLSFSSSLRFISLYDCIEDMGGFENQGNLSTENFFKTEQGYEQYDGVLETSSMFPEKQVVEAETFSRTQGWFGLSSGFCGTNKLLKSDASLRNIDADGDGVLTEQEVYLEKSVYQLNIYMEVFLPNLYHALICLLLLGDLLVLYIVVSAWLPTKMKN